MSDHLYYFVSCSPSRLPRASITPYMRARDTMHFRNWDATRIKRMKRLHEEEVSPRSSFICAHLVCLQLVAPNWQFPRHLWNVENTMCGASSIRHVQTHSPAHTRANSSFDPIRSVNDYSLSTKLPGRCGRLRSHVSHSLITFVCLSHPTRNRCFNLYSMMWMCVLITGKWQRAILSSIHYNIYLCILFC